MITGKTLAETAEQVINNRVSNYCEKIINTVAFAAANNGERSCTHLIPAVLKEDETLKKVISKFRDEYQVECEISEPQNYIYLRW